MNKVAQGQAGKNEQKKLSAYLRNKQNNGELTSAEHEVAKKLGVNGGNEGSAIEVEPMVLLEMECLLKIWRAMKNTGEEWLKKLQMMH
ncbi:hypothetical protein [Lachnotalea glycerini]|uniref:hypothetical protein n=1 Tax=Lachnotalea glycerini TaxID=1763509 RepID=UPI0015F254D3|nr:hypothetical protein [Lachnotalea glycerini]